MDSSVHEGKNSFDYGLWINTNNIVLIGFSEGQQMSHPFVEGLGSVRPKFYYRCAYLEN